MVNISSYFVGLPGGLLMSLIAFSIVFLVIVGLMLMMFALKSVVGMINSTSEAKKAAPAAVAPAVTSAPATVSTAAEDDGELLAVITAAITAVCGAGARIVSFTKAPERTPSTPWRMTGRLQNSEGFLD